MLKTKTERFLAITVAFLAGCEVSNVARTALYVPEAHADEPARRWEYSCANAKPSETTALANRYAAAGWELTAAAQGLETGFLESHQETVWCFRRPYVAPPPGWTPPPPTATPAAPASNPPPSSTGR